MLCGGGFAAPRRYTPIIHTSYAVALYNAVLPAAARCFQFYLYVVFALAERKNDIRTEGKYRCE